MDTFAAYIPVDRRLALWQRRSLPDTAVGAALFADISGFTPLTERLALLFGPRRGAEELSRHLNDVYEALIGQVEYFGGSVISFAGDSITCWFDEQQGKASQRAIAAALALQTVMAVFSEIPLADGHTAYLAMKTAVTTGPARRFLVGDPAIQLLDTLAGRTITRLAAAEKLAQPGELLADQATVHTLGTAVTITTWRQSPTSDHTFAVITDLATAVPAHHWPPLPADALTLAQTRPWLLTAVYQREQTGQGQFLTELRPSVALFLRFTGLNYEDDPDAAHKLNDFVHRVQNILTQYGGALLQLTIGDKGSYLYASFGAPIAHEDDAFRAANAALELEKLPFLAGTPVQIGMSRGVMRAGSYGSQSRRTYGVLGDHVNLAARLMERAEPGQILVSETVEKLLRRGYYLEPVEAVPLKGKSETVPVFSLTRRRRPQTGILQAPDYSIPLVGRRAELEQIRQKLALARQGQGQIVGIMAEAGMGKSRLVNELTRLAEADGLPIYLGECQSYGDNIPYLVWLPIWFAFLGINPTDSLAQQMETLQTQVARLAPERQEGLPLLGVALGLPVAENEFTLSLDAKGRRSALEALLLACMQSRARQVAAEGNALVFVFEDLHWIDPISHDLLEGLGRAIVQLPVLIIIAYRPPEQTRLQKPRLTALPHFTAVPLTELPAPEAEQLTRHKLKQLFAARATAVPPTLINQIIERAQGNPFYVEELVNYLFDRGLNLQDAAALENLDLPTSLHSLILSRIDQLNEDQKLTLRIASIIGRLFRFGWLLGYYPELGTADQVRAHLLELERLDLTPVDQPEPELVYMFKHIVTQEVTYTSLPYATRALLHEQLAQYIEKLDAERFVDLLAFHYGRSHNLPKKLEYLVKAGIAAADRFANEEAVDYLSRAITLMPEGEYGRLYDLHQRREQLYDLQGDRVQQQTDLAALHRLARLLRDHSQEADAALRQARYAEVTGDYSAASEAAQQALAMSRLARRPTQEAAAYLQWGRALFRQADYEKARRCFRHAHDLAARTSETDLAADCLMNLGNVAWSKGDYGDAQTHYQQALNLKQQIHNRRGESILLNNLGVVALSQSDYTTARTHYLAALAVMQAIGDRRNESFVLGNLGLVAAHLGHYREAELYQRQSLRLRQEMADSFGANLSQLNLGTIALYQGDYAQALALYEPLLAKYREANNAQSEVEVLVCLALLHHQLNDQAQALTYAQEAADITEKVGLRSEGSLAWRTIGHAQAALGHYAAAGAAYQRATALCREVGNLNWEQESLAGLARLALAQGKLDTAVTHVNTILSHLQTGNLHGADEPLRVYLTCYQVLQAAGDGRAAAILSEAYHLLQERAAGIEDATMRERYVTAVPFHREIVRLSQSEGVTQ
jgi:class 3 adenylate cyclase/tetratricopeptide (TPR) repeat protein